MAEESLIVPEYKALSWPRRLWHRYQTVPRIVRIGFPVGLAFVFLSAGWNVLGQDEYGVAMALVALFVICGVGAIWEIKCSRKIRIAASMFVILVGVYSCDVVWAKKGDKPWTTLRGSRPQERSCELNIDSAIV